MKQFARKRLLVDSQVQWAFLRRAIGYWLMCVVMVLLLLGFTNMVVEPMRLFLPDAVGPGLRLGPTIAFALLLLPAVVYDFLRVSNRLVGPVARLRGAMRALADGQHVEPIQFRQDDFWRDFAEEFNALARRMHVNGGCCAGKPEMPPGAAP